jgi:NADPH-dependent curcumin reductase CurA
MGNVNRQITLAARPVGLPKVPDFELVYSSIPSPSAGQVLVRAAYLALDPCTRHLMQAIAIGDVMPGSAVAIVVTSDDPTLRAGDAVAGILGWQEYAVASAGELRKLDPDLAPISTALGALGAPGLTAYFGLSDICDPQPGETVVVSGAAGAVGMMAGQIARIRGCRVVGVAAPESRVSWLVDELGFDAAVGAASPADLRRQLTTLCPGGIDVYFDTMGGMVTDAVMQCLRRGARVAACGQSSESSQKAPEWGPRWLRQLVLTEARVEGFRVASFAARFAEGLAQLATWLAQGKLRYREDVAQGIAAAPQAFISMLQGHNQGEQLVQLSEL